MVSTPGTSLVVTRGVAVPSTGMTTRRAVAPAVLGSGLGAPAYRAFRQRLDECLRYVAEIWTRANVVQMRSALLAVALTDQLLLQASDEQLQAFLLYAAETQLDIGTKLTPIVDVDPRTQQVTIAAVEKVAGLVELIRRAGAVDVVSRTVYAADHFKERFDAGDRTFEFEQNIAVRDRGDVVAFFAVVDLPHGKWSAKVLTVDEVQQLRAAARTPEHKAWREYFARMGELSALRAIAAWVPQGHGRAPTDHGRSRTETPERTSPLMALDPNDPYGSAATRTEDDVVTVEPLFADADAAARECVPGGPQDFSGCGGQPIGRCTSAILRGVRRWIRLTAERRVRYARLDQAVAMVLATRRVDDTDPTTTPGATR